MLDQVLDFFEITPDFDLNVMKPNQNLYSLTATIIEGMKPVLEELQPDLFMFMEIPQHQWQLELQLFIVAQKFVM